MFFKLAMIDLDNTIYDYDSCHQRALFATIEQITQAHAISGPDLMRSYKIISQRLKDELKNTAACHSRFIYFKQLSVTHSLPLSEVTRWHNLYWRTFYESIKIAPGVFELLSLLKMRNIKIVLLSDFLIDQQFRKLEVLGLLDLFDDIITSEEVGVEKPSSKMFLAALARTGVTADQAVMIGDSLTKDIEGAVACGIYGFQVNGSLDEPKFGKNYSCFPNIDALQAWFQGLDHQLGRLEALSRFCGERFDLTQGPGGNISVKFGDCLCIKSSGLLLSDVTRRGGYSILDNARLLRDVDARTPGPVDAYSLFTCTRASIETYMHAVLYDYTVHLHPLQVNIILTREGGGETVRSLFPDSLVLDYVTPGAGIADALLVKQPIPEIVFLLNHGLIVSSNDFGRIFEVIDTVVRHCEDYLGRSFVHYRVVTQLSTFLNNITGKSFVCYACEDAVIERGMLALDAPPPLFPDVVVYCGTKILALDDLTLSVVETHLAKYGIPKLVTYAGRLYIYDQSLRKCRDVECILKSVLLMLSIDVPGRIAHLSADEVAFLGDWEAEAYRRTLQS